MENKIDNKTSRKAASLLTIALAEIRAQALLEDFYSNYSLAEVFQERLDFLGSPNDTSKSLTKRGTRTAFAEISYLEEQLNALLQVVSQMDKVKNPEVTEIDGVMVLL